MIIIKVDSRERAVIDLFTCDENMNFPLKAGQYSNVHVKLEIVNNMKRSDYSIVLKQNDEEILLHAFERKAMPDLAASIKNDNLHIGSTLELREQTGCKISYIIEHKTVFYHDNTQVPKTRMNFKQINAVLNHLLVEHDIPIIYTGSQLNTAKKLTDLAFIYGKLFKLNRLKIGKYNYVNYNNIEKIGGAEILNQKIKSSLKDYVKKMWLSLPSIGPDTAEALMQNTSIKDVIMGIYTLEDIQTTSINNKKIGKRVDDTYKILTKSTNEYHKKLIKSVQGVSVAKANRIFANNITIKDLCDKTKIKTIADVLVNGRRIGDKVATRIYDCLSYTESEI